jgi:hypothetical protein
MSETCHLNAHSLLFLNLAVEDVRKDFSCLSSDIAVFTQKHDLFLQNPTNKKPLMDLKIYIFHNDT